MFGAISVRIAASSLWPTPNVAFVFVIVIAAFFGFSNLISFWLIADHIGYLWRGYRVRRLIGTQWLYEERGTERSLPYVCVVLDDGYSADCEVHVPSEASWETEVPNWAHCRRSEIMERIALSFGSDRGAHISFVSE